MTTIFLSILIVYSITNIIVLGSIFDDPKTILNKFISYLKTCLTFNENDLDNLTKYRYKGFTQYIDCFIKYETCIMSSKNPSEKLIENFNKSRTLLINKINEYKSKRYFIKTILYLLEKFNELISCFMCTGFWIGCLYTILTTFININMFDISLTLIVWNGIPWFISLLLLSCMFSGTSWIISKIIGVLIVLEDKLETTIIED